MQSPPSSLQSVHYVWNISVSDLFRLRDIEGEKAFDWGNTILHPLDNVLFCNPLVDLISEILKVDLIGKMIRF